MGSRASDEKTLYMVLEEAYRNSERCWKTLVEKGLNFPYPKVRSLAASLLFRVYDKNTLPDKDLLSMLFDPLIKSLSFPITLGRASKFTFFLRATTQGFAVFLRHHDSYNLSRILRFFKAGLHRSIPQKGFRKGIAKIILGFQTVLEARTVIQRKGKISLPDDIGPAITYSEAKSFFKLPKAQKFDLLELLTFCDPNSSDGDEALKKIREYAQKDYGLAYNFVSGALLIQAGTDPARFLPFLKKLFYEGNAMSRYTAVRILLYLLEYAPNEFITPRVIQAATDWILKLIKNREATKIPLDYSYPIAQICYVLNRNVQSSAESSPGLTRWIEESLKPFSEACNLEEKVVIVRGAKQFQHMQGRFCADINVLLLGFPADLSPGLPNWYLYRVLEQAFVELRITFPKRTRSFFEQVQTPKGLISMSESSIELARSIYQSMSKRKIPEYPQYIGWSVNLVTFFQNILVYGGEMRTIMLELLDEMGNSKSLWSYLKYLSDWLLDTESMDKLANAARTFQTETGFSWGSPGLLEILENLNQ